MFSFRFGQAIRVHTASSFKDSEGNPAFCILMVESENQPEGLERPSKSKSQIKIWGKGELPESIFRNIDVAGENIAEMVCIRSTGNVWQRHHTTVGNR